MNLCPHCNEQSAVVLSRNVRHKFVNPDTATTMRTRQCKKCRFKWKTVEYHITVSKNWKEINDRPQAKAKEENTNPHPGDDERAVPEVRKRNEGLENFFRRAPDITT
jgi:hypothetical protein